MELPVARTAAEARLFLDLVPCEVCGELETSWRLATLETIEGTAAERYAGSCAHCGSEREQVFALARPSAPTTRFGGNRPSELLDAAQWLEVATVAEAAASNATLDAASADQARHNRRADLAYAADAVREAVKFLPPGAAEVPAESLFSAHGHRVRDEEPWRLTRDFMESMLADYEELSS